MSFNTFLAGTPACEPELPLVHNTTCERFPGLAASGVLTPSFCQVFQEPLLYFFYGRPVYRPAPDAVNASTLLQYCPICLVFKPDAVPVLARAFPFDSGAADNGRFDPQVLPADRDRYALQPALVTAKRIVGAFFETNGRYYLGEPRAVFAKPPHEVEVGNYWDLISVEGEAEFDERRSAIELQSRTAVALRDNLHAVILPTKFLGAPSVREAIREWRAIPRTYPTPRGGIPNEYVRDIVNEFSDLFSADL